MKRLVMTLPVVVLVVAIAAGCGSSSSSSSVSGDNVAVVKDQNITKAQLDQEIALVQASLKGQGQTVPKAGTTAYKQQVIEPALQSLVSNADVETIAQNMNLSVSDADVQKTIDQLIQKAPYNGSKAKFEADVKKYGYTDETVKDLFRIRLLGNKIQAAVTKDVSLSASDLHQKYTKAPQVFGDARNVHYSLWPSKADAQAALAKLNAGQAESKVTAKAIDADTKHGTNGFMAASGPGLMETNFQKAAFTQPVGKWGDLVLVDKSYAASSLGGQCKPNCYFLINPIGPVLKAGTPAAEKALHSTIVQKYNSQQTVSAQVQAKLEALVAALKKDTHYADGYAPPAASTAPTTTSSSSSNATT
jgi:hypothetical protein